MEIKTVNDDKNGNKQSIKSNSHHIYYIYIYNTQQTKIEKNVARKIMHIWKQIHLSHLSWAASNSMARVRCNNACCWEYLQHEKCLLNIRILYHQMTRCLRAAICVDVQDVEQNGNESIAKPSQARQRIKTDFTKTLIISFGFFVRIFFPLAQHLDLNSRDFIIV